ncbi:non-haem Fe2+, alpha-ketoglutarate-dependent halogenase [Paraburkholderia steynii]|uniref:Non-haem Fe2+, alpha-ketoglutarate-dependent halogenase n=1 Tax=Paraburkholderia steynii TaxID=1245441 RepID=A0A7Z7BLK5_9BURK|nr:chlorinating enzyme [Paraburkholderia steynii]SDJ53534.1 non-haem Fe2+, alpha-ketoglutarate-dependent halogenase [Paraburkholderia steynii]
MNVGEVRKKFFENGFYGPFDVYEPVEAKNLLMEIRRKSRDMSNAIFKNECNYDRHFDIDELASHIENRTVIDHVSAILGQNLLCWRSEFFPKFPGAKGTEWHQVERFQYTTGNPQLQPSGGQPGDIPFELTVWTTFTESDVENGCMKFLPGSHRHKYFDETIEPKTGRNAEYSSISADTSFFGYNFSEFKVDPEWTPNEDEAVSVEMEPGQAIIFTAKCVHGSHPNTTKNKTRFAISSRYVSTDVLVYPNQKNFVEHGGAFDLSEYGVVHVSGVDEYSHNRIRKRTNTGYTFR